MHYIRYTHILSDLVIYYANSKPISARITLFFYLLQIHHLFWNRVSRQIISF